MLTSAYFAFAALVTLAASDDVYASTNYHSRCIGAENGDICSVIPFGTRDRYIDADMTVFRQFTPLCGVALDDPNVAFVVQDISHHDASKNRALEIDGGAFWLAAPEPGTHLFNLTLSNRTTGELMDSLLLCMELTLPIGPGSWEQAYNSASDALYARIASSSPDACCPMPHATLAAYASNGPLQYTMDGVLPAGGDLDIKPISILWVSDMHASVSEFSTPFMIHCPRCRLATRQDLMA